MRDVSAKIIKDLTLKFNNLEDQKKHSHEFLFDIIVSQKPQKSNKKPDIL